ncbi:hypothetical protein M446_4950 [Methylobacterium sp. 4-46]|nr:hypothetical protein M446_4950 [Methylobacterium sp. 4-46]
MDDGAAGTGRRRGGAVTRHTRRHAGRVISAESRRPRRAGQVVKPGIVSITQAVRRRAGGPGAHQGLGDEAARMIALRRRFLPAVQALGAAGPALSR